MLEEQEPLKTDQKLADESEINKDNQDTKKEVVTKLRIGDDPPTRPDPKT